MAVAATGRWRRGRYRARRTGRAGRARRGRRPPAQPHRPARCLPVRPAPLRRGHGRAGRPPRPGRGSRGGHLGGGRVHRRRRDGALPRLLVVARRSLCAGRPGRQQPGGAPGGRRTPPCPALLRGPSVPRRRYGRRPGQPVAPPGGPGGGRRAQVLWDDGRYPYLVSVHWSARPASAAGGTAGPPRPAPSCRADCPARAPRRSWPKRATTPGWTRPPACPPGPKRRALWAGADAGTWRLKVGERWLTPPGLQVREVTSAGRCIVFTASTEPETVEAWSWSPKRAASVS